MAQRHKGKRTQLSSFVHPEVASVIRRRAKKSGVCVSDYMAAVIADHLKSDELPTPVEVPDVRRIHLASRMPDAHADEIRRRARSMGIAASPYLAAVLAIHVGRTDLLASRPDGQELLLLTG